VPLLGADEAKLKALRAASQEADGNPVSLPLSHKSKNQPQESNCRWTGIVQVIPNDSKGWGKPQGRGVEEPIVDRF